MIAEPFWHTNGASHSPARKSLRCIPSASIFMPSGNFFSSASSQSPTALSHPSSIWKRSPARMTAAQPTRSSLMLSSFML